MPVMTPDQIEEAKLEGVRGAEALVRPVRVVAIVPCFNRREDARLLLDDLACAQTRLSDGQIDLRVILVDNASDHPLSDLPTPAGLNLQHLRLDTNTGGSGGYSAGLGKAQDMPDVDYVWLVDSDARVESGTLAALLGVMQRDDRIVAAGAAIADPKTGQVFELGGRVDRRTGSYAPCVEGAVGVRGVVDCEYVASCCVLVRSSAARHAGAFPDRFLNGDDVEWFIRMRQRTRGRVVAVPWARAMHPRFDRFHTWTRYYTTRNAHAPLDALGLSWRVKLRRSLHDVARAARHALAGRHDLARLHMLGLRDLARGRTAGRAGAGVISVAPSVPQRELPPELRVCLRMPTPSSRGFLLDLLGFTVRICLGPEFGAAVVPERPGLHHACRGCVQLHADGAGGYVVRPAQGVRDTLRAIAVCCWGVLRAGRAALLTRGDGPSPPDIQALLASAQRALCKGLDTRTRASLDIVVLSYNRKDTLLRTLRALHADPLLMSEDASCTITVVDNASTDGSTDAIKNEFPGVSVLALSENLGIEAFNRAAKHQLKGGVLLILDDDAIPQPGALSVALAWLHETPSLGAVTLLPRHPATGESEWAFASDPAGPRRMRWPVMGCANLVRTRAWDECGGYEPSFFLYRNDTDLALQLLERGWDVGFDPALVVWHDTPAGPGMRKSTRWHRLATRNWVWMVRRHGRGLAVLVGIVLGWASAHASARGSWEKHRATIAGVWAGLRERPITPAHASSGVAWRAYLRLRLLGR